MSSNNFRRGLAAFLIVIAAEGLLACFGVFFKPLLSEFGWTKAVIAGAYSLSAFLIPFTSYLGGSMADRLGPRIVLSACGFFLGMGYILMSLTGSLWHLYFSRGILMALGFGLYWVPLISVLPRWFTRNRAQMMGLITSGVGIGQSIVPLVANQLMITYGWRAASALIGLIIMGTIMFCALYLKSDTNRSNAPSPENDTTRMGNLSKDSPSVFIGKIIFTKKFWFTSVIFFSWAFCISVVLVHIVTYGIEIGLSPTNAANIMVIVGIVGIFGRLFFGYLISRIGLKSVLIVSFAPLTLVFVFLGLLEEKWVVFLFAAVFGFINGTGGLSQSLIIVELFGLNDLGTILGLTLAIGTFGAIIGPILAGYIFDITGSYNIAFLICASVGVVGVIFSKLSPLK